MRVLFCKIHCPSFICFCKSTSHIYTPGPLKLENTPHVSSTETINTTVANDHQFVCGDADEETNQDKEKNLVVNGKRQQQEEEEREGGGQEEEEEEEEESEFCPRSSLKKLNSELEQQTQKKKVQWMDLLGKDLVEIREFEASEVESEDDECEFRRGCVCTIL